MEEGFTFGGEDEDQVDQTIVGEGFEIEDQANIQPTHFNSILSKAADSKLSNIQQLKNMRMELKNILNQEIYSKSMMSDTEMMDFFQHTIIQSL